MANCDEDKTEDAKVSGKRVEREEEELIETKRQKLMEEIKLSLPQNLSKTQLKKQIKTKYREKMKSEWKRQKKEKEKLKRKAKSKMTSDKSQTNERPVRLMSSAEASPLRVAIELGYQELMVDNDIKMLMKQCQRCYAENRHSEKPVQLYLTSFSGKCKERMEQCNQGYQNWDIHFKEDSFLKVFDKKEIVFLAAESPNVLSELSYDKVYVIGGLVDHNHHKGYCYNEAVTAGVSHAQLPISQHVALNSRAVLAVNHVFEILLAYEVHKDWQKALTDVIPKRKLIVNNTTEPCDAHMTQPTSNNSDELPIANTE